MPTITATSAKARTPVLMPQGTTVRDRPLGGRMSVSYEDLSKVADLPPARSKAHAQAIAAITLDAAMEVRGDRRRTSYSRSRTWWSSQSPYQDLKCYTYDHVVSSVDALVEAGILEDHVVGLRGSGPTGWQSSYVGADALRGIVLPRSTTIVPPRSLVRLRDRRTKMLVPTPRTQATQRRARWVERFNEASAATDIAIGHGTVDGDLLTFKRVRDGREVTHTLNRRQTALYRVYSGDMEKGGRLYGHWVQGVPSELREGVLLGGERTVEHDYAALHIHLLYASAGLRLPEDRDPYTDCDWESDLEPVLRRRMLKRGLNVLINADGYHQAVGAMATVVAEQDGNDERRGSYTDRARAMLKSLSAAHPEVSHLFHKDLGILFQNVDSEIAVEVCDRIALRGSVPVIPVHDSFIVPERHSDRLKEVMAEALEKAISGNMERVAKPKTSSRFILHMGGTAGASRSSSRSAPASVQPDSESGVYLSSASDPGYLASLEADASVEPVDADHLVESSLAPVRHVEPSVPSSAEPIIVEATKGPSEDIPRLSRSASRQPRRFVRPSFIQSSTMRF